MDGRVQGKAYANMHRNDEELLCDRVCGAPVSHQEQYLSMRPELRERDYGDISDRVALRKRLQCHSFRWYLDTVYPEMQTVSNGNKHPPLFINKDLKRPKVLQRGLVPPTQHLTDFVQSNSIK